MMLSGALRSLMPEGRLLRKGWMSWASTVSVAVSYTHLPQPTILLV